LLLDVSVCAKSNYEVESVKIRNKMDRNLNANKFVLLLGVGFPFSPHSQIHYVYLEESKMKCIRDDEESKVRSVALTFLILMMGEGARIRRS
jgi:hypothetical protein